MNPRFDARLRGAESPKKQTVEDVTLAAMQSLVVLTSLIAKIVELMETQADALGVLAMYAERKGLADGVLDQGDFEKEGDNGTGN